MKYSILNMVLFKKVKFLHAAVTEFMAHYGWNPYVKYCLWDAFKSIQKNPKKLPKV